VACVFQRPLVQGSLPDAIQARTGPPPEPDRKKFNVFARRRRE